MDDHEGSGDEAAPALRRSTRASVRKRSVSAGGRTLSPEHAKVHRDLLKQQSRTAYELEQLAHALYSLHQWRQAEATFYERCVFFLQCLRQREWHLLFVTVGLG